MDFDKWWAQTISPQTPANSFQPYNLAKAAWDAGVAAAEQNRSVPPVEAPPPQAQAKEEKAPPRAREKVKSGKGPQRR